MTQKTYSAEELQEFEGRLDILNISDEIARRFYMACLTGDLDTIIELKDTVDITAPNNPALRWAAENRHLDVVKYLSEHAEKIHIDNDYALRYASTYMRLGVLHKNIPFIHDFTTFKSLNFENWQDEHFKEFFSLRFMMQNPFMVQRVWDIVPQDKKTPAVIQHYQKNMTLVLLRRSSQQKLAVG